MGLNQLTEKEQKILNNLKKGPSILLDLVLPLIIFSCLYTVLSVYTGKLSNDGLVIIVIMLAVLLGQKRIYSKI